MRAQIFSADSLSSWEEYFNLTTSSAGGSGINLFAIGFASDGNIYLGTDASTPIIVLKENKSIVPLYPGVLSPLFHIFAKGPMDIFMEFKELVVQVQLQIQKRFLKLLYCNSH